ncbi:hypothetical protein [Aureimonas jatrophae]|uniref:Uncharacterized protein n=1 Tax=Aureimonas jatrophae TaxID=1166073 RepID=A0A1H0LFU2_9HYPH|nr:hypothetical protein [Aureimonas jatrophae]MBB3952501.1 hypothetical protein [Aureimonas jatrophae]SDO67014.1 hypothetical protein SAMN05192530_11018 [Aureimonas jatrophae]
MSATFEQVAGAALILVFLADVFMTVLYARAGTGLLAPYWNRAVWAVFRIPNHQPVIRPLL